MAVFIVAIAILTSSVFVLEAIKSFAIDLVGVLGGR